MSLFTGLDILEMPALDRRTNEIGNHQNEQRQAKVEEQIDMCGHDSVSSSDAHGGSVGKQFCRALRYRAGSITHIDNGVSTH